METKAEIRSQILAVRSMISEQEWKTGSRLIFEQAVCHPLFVAAKELYCYVSCKGEVDTFELIKHAWKMGKRVAVPKTSLRHGMEFYYIENFSQLTPGYFQILEPVTTQKAEAAEALLIMPGVAFDKKLSRIGYGKGFYDSYLSKHPGYHTIALAFSTQCIDEIPAEEHDQSPEVLLTEKEDIRMFAELPGDSVILLSVINTKLRHYYKSLDELCEDMNVSLQDISGKLQSIDYVYNEKQNRFI